MTESNASNIPPSQDIDDEYTFKLLGILSRTAEEAADGWSKLGLILNFDRDAGSLLTYSTVIWNGKHYAEWIPDLEQHELSTEALLWTKRLSDAGFPCWTSMFLGMGSDRHFVWIPNYEADHGPWKLDVETDNWPTMEKALEEV